MKAVWLYRIAAIIFVLFTVGHTFGFLTFRPANPEGLAVWDAMNRVPFTVGGNTFTYGGFYKGFGIDISMYLAFSAFLAWHLSVLVRRAPQAIGALGWGFVVLQMGGLVLAWVYFGRVQVALGAVVALCVACAMFALPKSPA